MDGVVSARRLARGANRENERGSLLPVEPAAERQQAACQAVARDKKEERQRWPQTDRAGTGAGPEPKQEPEPEQEGFRWVLTGTSRPRGSSSRRLVCTGPSGSSLHTKRKNDRGRTSKTERKAASRQKSKCWFAPMA